MISDDNGSDITIALDHTGIAETEAEDEILGVEIYDLLGRRMEESELTPGLYIVRYQTKNGIVVKKIMKR